MTYILLILILLLLLIIRFVDFGESKNKKEHLCIFGIGDCDEKPPITIKQEVNQEVVNKSDLKLIKENINKNIMEAITKKAAECSALQQASQTQSVQIGMVAGDFNIDGGNQKQIIKMQLKCIQLSETQNNMAQTIVNDFTNQVSSKFDVDAMAKLEANAKSEATTGILGGIGGGPNAGANVENKFNISIRNGMSKTIQDIIKNETNKTFNTDTLQKSLSEIIAAQEQRFAATAVGGSVNIKLGSQDQDIQTFQEAIQKDVTINATIDNIANKLNSISTEGTTTKLSTEAKATAETKTEKKGLDTITGQFTDMVGGMFKGWVWIVIAVVFVIMIIGVVFFMTGGQETLQMGIETAGDMAGGEKKINNQSFTETLKKLVKKTR